MWGILPWVLQHGLSHLFHGMGRTNYIQGCGTRTGIGSSWRVGKYSVVIKSDLVPCNQFRDISNRPVTLVPMCSCVTIELRSDDLLSAQSSTLGTPIGGLPE